MATTVRRSMSLLMHPARRRIYSLVCESPGTYFHRIGEVLEIPAGTLAWHLKKLQEDGLIGTIKHGGKRIFFPVGLRSPEVEKIFMVLQNATTRRVFLHVVNNSSHTQTEIAQKLDLHHDTARYHLTALENVELIELIRDGRTVRASKGPAAIRLQKGSLNAISDVFVSFLTSKLIEGCLHPEVVRQSSERLILRIECPVGEDIILSLDLSEWSLFEAFEEENAQYPSE
ncbi:MAG: winged helix-turn-helix transcriptional regulator [Candidatus Heimdallarchaeota archaeon]